jgi:hypothetical protein
VGYEVVGCRVVMGMQCGFQAGEVEREYCMQNKYDAAAGLIIWFGCR